MRFRAEHDLYGSPAEVAELLADPGFYRSLVLPDLSQPEVLESAASSERSSLRLRYEYVGSLDPMVRRLVGQARLSWLQEIVVDGATGAGELTFKAQVDPRRLFGTARFTLEAKGNRCVRRLEGELVVAVPVIGPRAEGKIVPGVLRRLDIEAEAINETLR